MNSHDLLLLLPESFLTAAICVLLYVVGREKAAK